MEVLEEVKAILGNPYYEKLGFILYNMDCLEGLRKIEKPIIDLAVTSPPYNIGKEYEKVMLLKDYIEFSQKWTKEIYRLTKPHGAFLLNIGYVEVPNKGHAVPLAYLVWDKTEFYLLQEIVWNYGAGVACKRKLSPRNEKILWYVKDRENYAFNLDDIRDKDVKYPNQKKKGKLRCNILGKNPSDVWQIAKVTSGNGRASPERTGHPAQFPVDLIERIVKGFSNIGDVVLDPFMGSGTVAEVAIRNRRKVVGFEIKPEYCEYIVERIERHFGDTTASLNKYLQAE
jgi:adenine-specific DNA-methyltransferase